MVRTGRSTFNSPVLYDYLRLNPTTSQTTHPSRFTPPGSYYKAVSNSVGRSLRMKPLYPRWDFVIARWLLGKYIFASCGLVVEIPTELLTMSICCSPNPTSATILVRASKHPALRMRSSSFRGRPPSHRPALLRAWSWAARLGGVGLTRVYARSPSSANFYRLFFGGRVPIDYRQKLVP